MPGELCPTATWLNCNGPFSQSMIASVCCDDYDTLEDCLEAWIAKIREVWATHPANCP